MENIHKFEAGYIFSQIWVEIEKLVSVRNDQVPYLLPLIFTAFSAIIFLLVIRKIISIFYLINQKPVFLELTPPAFTEKTAYTTQQFFSLLHNIGSQRSLIDRILGRKVLFSFEIVSSREKGIRYIVKTSKDEADTVERMVTAYLPFVRIKRITEYLPEKLNYKEGKVIEFKQAKHYAYPLAGQNKLNQHDPVAYITGMMTKLKKDELISFQVIISPTKKSEVNLLTRKILNNEDVFAYLNKLSFPWYLSIIAIPLTFLIKIINFVMRESVSVINEVLYGSSNYQVNTNRNALYQEQLRMQRIKPARTLSVFEQQEIEAIQNKIDQSLFECSIRALIKLNTKQEQKDRVRGIKSSLAPFTVPQYQSLKPLLNFPPIISNMTRLFNFKHRLLSMFANKSSSLLSVSEIADLYHFPYTDTTKTENIVKVLSKKLPAPLSLKNDRKLHVVFGKNTYGDTPTSIGLTEDERKTHMYIIGRTGCGKTTLMFAMAKHDIENNSGMAFIDPHGDVSSDLLSCIPLTRKNDLIYINPIDLKYPVGINLLELTPGLDEDEAELEKEVVCEGVISLFRKVFSKDENANAHRIEYILRNTIYTAFTIKDATIFTLYDLLNNPPFQKQVIKQLTDENLINFWKFEFGRAGDYQVVKMVGGVTAKVGRFLFSPTAKRILEQKRSTINFDRILDQGKILICNFSQGNLGEDTARLLGTTILTKIQQAALRRARVPNSKRKPFYLYVDEFQNFATHSFIKMLSEGRKYGLSVCIAEQSTSQQEEKNMVHTILANVTTVICFRSANPVDEELMLTQFAPYVEKGDIANLPAYNFYIKISATEPEEPFSGETLLIPIKRDEKNIEELINASRNNYASVYKKQTVKQKQIKVEKVEKNVNQKKNNNKNKEKNKQTIKTKIGLPETRNKK